MPLNGWMDNPSKLEKREVAVIAISTALIIGSDYALAEAVNIKLMDTVVFVVAFLFGFRMGAVVGILSETIWSFASTWGVAGALTPFLAGGELLFAIAGWGASKVWKGEVKVLGPTSLYFGSLLAICAFAWDFETNAASAVLYLWPNLTVGEFFAYQLQGTAFFVLHELSDFAFGFSVAPAAIARLPLVLRGWKLDAK